MADGQFMRVHCRVRAESKIGQVVGLALSTSNHYDKNSAIERLVTTPESYPVWYTLTPLIVPTGQTTYYRYCLVEGTEVVAFEVLGSDDEDEGSGGSRIIQGGGKMDVLIEDIFSPEEVESTMRETAGEKIRKLSVYAREEELAEFKIEGANRLFIACYHLPVSVKRQPDKPEEPFIVTWNDSLIAKSSDSVSDSMKTYWVGTVTVGGPKLTREEEAALTVILDKMNCVPIFLEPELTEAAYHGFCKDIMWPIFHNVDQLDHIHAAWNLPDGGDGAAGAGGGGAGAPTSGGISSSVGGHGQGGASSASASATAATIHDGQEVKWKHNEEVYYSAYENVSKIFDSKLASIANTKNDVVWVHDYHLMLLPALLRARNTGVKIVFFLHIPFPTSQIFRSLPKATQLLQSMTCADICGFHAFDHTRHFLNATKRILGVRSATMEGGLLALLVQDRRVIVTMSHVSIEPDKLDALLALVDVQSRAAELREKHKGKKIIVGVDVCHRLSGVSLKLSAFDKLLSDYSSSTGSGVVLVQRCLRPGSRPKDEETTSVDIRKMVTAINEKVISKAAGKGGRAENEPVDSRGGGQDGGKGLLVAPTQAPHHHLAVDYEELPSLPLAQRLSLWLAADVFLLTPIREGLNNMPLEYIYARRNLDSAGVVVASEFSTCSSILSGSIKINPFNALSVADALDKALNMSAKECNQRRNRDISFVTTHPSSMWTKNILSDLQHIIGTGADGSVDGKNGNNNKKATPSPGHAPLQQQVDVKYLVECYKAAANVGLTPAGTRIFIFDYGGTLLFKEKFDVYIKQTLSAISGRKPNPRVMSALKVLSEDPNNVVMVMTGLTRLKLGDTFKGHKNITLVTSNGLVYSWGENLLGADDREKHSLLAAAAAAAGAEAGAGASGGGALNSNNKTTKTTSSAFHDDLYSQIDDEGRMWHNFDFGVDWEAVCHIAVPIMSQFTFRTNGTCLSPRIPGAGWSYFGADPDWGEKQANQLRVCLEAALAKHDVKVVSQIQGSIELAPRELQKGVMVKRLFDKLLAVRAGKLPAFTLIIGDEPSDDAMFSEMFKTLAEATPFAGVSQQRSFMVTVGKRPSPSALYLNDVDEVEDILCELVK